MRTRRSKTPARNAEIAPKPGEITDGMVREAEDKVGRMTLFARSEEWALQKTVLTARADSLRAKREALLRRLGVTAADGQTLVTTEVLARLEGQIEENDRLLRFPEDTLARWTDQLRQMRDDQLRQRAGA